MANRNAASDARFAQLEIRRRIYHFRGSDDRSIARQQVGQAIELAEMTAEKPGPLDVKTTLASAHRTPSEGEAAAFARLDADIRRDHPARRR